MPSNDEVLFGIPDIYCPSCNSLLDTSKNRVDKYSKEQRKRMFQSVNYEASTTSLGRASDPFPNGEDSPSEQPEKNFIIFTCTNPHCEQYNKFKVMRIPRIHTPSVKVDLGD